MSEQNLCTAVAEHFTVRGYRVFQEVHLGGRCDLVVRLHRLAFGIEAKTEANLAVLAQATRHFGRAHGVYVAVPAGKRSHKDFCAVARSMGLGVIEVHSDGSCTEPVDARITRWLAPKHEQWLRDTLTPQHEQLGGQAGTPGGSAAWTSFRQFQLEVWRMLRRHGPLTVKQLAVELQSESHRWHWYHWHTDTSARRALFGYFSKGLIPCVAPTPDTRPTKWQAIGQEFKAA